MCGIHLQVSFFEHCGGGDGAGGHDRDNDDGGCSHEGEPVASPSSDDWLKRRGPDHTGCRSFDVNTFSSSEVFVSNDGDQEEEGGTLGEYLESPAACDVPTSSTRGRSRSRENIRVVLRASVLRMRGTLVEQPVKLRCESCSLEEKEDDDDNNNNCSGGCCCNNYYFAWNGEAYQTTPVPPTGDSRATTVSGEDEEDISVSSATTKPPLLDVWQYDQPDTSLVARMLEEALLVKEGDDGERDEATASDTATHCRILNKVATAISPLVDAEYAFCLTTPRAAYYGRDRFGRRSLLVHSPSDSCSCCCCCCCCCNDHTNSCTNNHLRRRWREHCWQLSSVANIQKRQQQQFAKSDDCTNGAMSKCCLGRWREVEPGRVHCYNFVTGGTSSVPIRQQKRLPVTAAAVERLRPRPHAAVPSDRMELASIRLEILLEEAVRRRMTSFGGGVSVLFSGGVDSAVVAALCLRLSRPSIDPPLTLVNVSFVDKEEGVDPNFCSPTPSAADTVAARATYSELRVIFPRHSIRFVERRVTWKEVREEESRIRHLIHPKTSAMDLNIATALWFAATATSLGALSSANIHLSNAGSRDVSFDSDEPRILLTGLGADEQMGGYGRHRKAYDRGGDDSLRHELDLDLNRLWERNLGRDDRVMSDASKEVRFPFLDFHVTRYLGDLPLDCVCDFSMPPGEGDKRILRLVARRLGLESACQAVKRAIQFGSRVAHVSDRQRFGSRRKATGQANV